VAPVTPRGVTVLHTELWILPTLLQAGERRKEKRRKRKEKRRKWRKEKKVEKREEIGEEIKKKK
jgi:hypothetical protein